MGEFMTRRLDLDSCVEEIQSEIEDIQKTFPEISFDRAFDVFALQTVEEGMEIDDAFEYTRFDGPGDNGIDALVIDEHEKTLCVYQFKTKEPPQFSPASDRFDRKCVSDIVNAKDFLQDLKKGKKRECNKELRDILHELREHLNEGYSITGRIVVGGTLTGPANDSFEATQSVFSKNEHTLQKFEIFDIAKLILLDAAEGIRPPEEIHLTFVPKKFYYDKNAGVISGQVCTNEIREVLKKQEKDVTLFGHNYRYFLGTTYKIGTVNRKIGETLRDTEKSKKFHVFNNGIRITCEKIIQTGSRDGNCFIMKHPEIVNGGQTSVVISRLSKKSKEVTVDVKVIETGKDEDLIRDIATGTNTQTAVEGWDFRANEPFQRFLLKSFSEFTPAWWYDIKKGEFETRIKPRTYLLRKYQAKGRGKGRKKERRIKPDLLSKAVLCFVGKPAEAKTKRKEFPEESGLYKQIFNIGLTPSEYLFYYLTYTQVLGKVESFKRKYREAEKNKFEEQYAAYKGKGFLRYCVDFVVASIAHCFELRYGTRRIGAGKAKSLIKKQKQLEKTVDQLYERIMNILESWAVNRENTLAELDMDPDWSNYFKKNETFTTTIMDTLKKNVSKNEIVSIFRDTLS